MTSAPVRDPLADHLITPQNAALLLIDYQPSQLAGVRSMDRDLLVKNAVSTVKTIKTFDIPVVHSTINVATGRGGPTLPELAGLLTDDKPLDRITTNSWEDIEFVEAVRATGRRKLIICALWTDSRPWVANPSSVNVTAWARNCSRTRSSCAQDTRPC
jgi:nicotinamidase-related amidase